MTERADDAAEVAATRQDAGEIAAATRVDDAAIMAARRHNRINMLWEYTQAFLAVSLTLGTIYASLRFPASEVIAGPDGRPVALPVPETLKNALFVVIGFYFGRTNHTRPVPGASQDG
jgi:hypothetical protein